MYLHFTYRFNKKSCPNSLLKPIHAINNDEKSSLIFFEIFFILVFISIKFLVEHNDKYNWQKTKCKPKLVIDTEKNPSHCHLSIYEIRYYKSRAINKISIDSTVFLS